jgi:hypothetical protein
MKGEATAFGLLVGKPEGKEKRQRRIFDVER